MKLSITVSDEVGNEFKNLATNSDASQRATIEYLLSLHKFRVEPTGTHKVEMQLKQWLYLGHDRKITQTDLFRVTGSNLRIIKNVLAQYKDEVQAFNNSLSNG